jgi:hypothetical protein
MAGRRSQSRTPGSNDARAKIARGLDDARAGRFVDSDATFRRLDRKIARRARDGGGAPTARGDS